MSFPPRGSCPMEMDGHACVRVCSHFMLRPFKEITCSVTHVRK